MHKIFLVILICSVGVFADGYPGSIKQIQGTPTLLIHNEPVYASGVRLNIEWGTVKKFIFQKDDSIFQQFSETRTPVMFLGTPGGWCGIDKYNYKYLDSVIDKLFKDYPKAYLIPSVFLDITWFSNNFPEERFCYIEKGKTKQLAYRTTFWSKRFSIEAKKALKHLIKHLESKGYAERILGYQINYGNTAEWNWWDKKKRPDVSSQAVTAWQNYLKNNYKTIIKTNSIHHKKWKNFKDT